MSLIYCPIQRINIPKTFTLSAAFAAFFGKDMSAGKMGLDLADQKCFRGVVCFGDKINYPFVLNRMFLVVSVTQDGARLAREALQIKKCRYHICPFQMRRPRAVRANSTASLAVWFCTSRIGLTSTTSMPIRLPVSA